MLLGMKNSIAIKKVDSVTDASSNNSSIPAINKLGNSSGLRKVLWLTILLVGLFQSGLRIKRFLHLYFQYPVVISLDIEEGNNLFFPAVTFCNLNRMRKEYEYCNDDGPSMRFCVSRNKSQFPIKPVPKNRVMVRIPERKIYSPGEKHSSSLSRSKCKKTLTKMNNFLTRFASETEEGRRLLGYQSHELIRDCWFDGKICSSDNFSQVQSLRYGNCYTFNSIGEEKSFRSHDLEATSGLQVVLSIDPDQYLEISQSLGAKVIIHSPEEYPDIDYTGVIISPGFETAIALRQTVHERLPSPYRDHCVSYRTGERFEQKSQMECIKTCIQNANYGTCGCLDPTMLKIDGLPMCNISNVTESYCLDDVLRKIQLSENVCDCPFACFSVSYNEQMSMSVWPSENLILRTEVSTEDDSQLSDKSKFKIFREGYARVRIFYSTFKRRTYSQRPMFHQTELYSYLGGELGLWLGLSIATLFEMLELFLKLCNCVL